MNVLNFSLFAFFAFSLNAYAEDVKCSCSEVPFEPDPPCVNACVAAILTNSKYEAIAANLELTESQKKTLVLYRNPKIDPNLLSVPTAEQKADLSKFAARINELPQEKFDYLKKSVPAGKLAISIPKWKVKAGDFDKLEPMR